jgi:hypothetical protein
LTLQLQGLLITLKYSVIADLHTFRFTVVHALGFSIFPSRLLATDPNTEISTSNHYEIFLLLRLRSLWNLGPQLKNFWTPNQKHCTALHSAHIKSLQADFMYSSSTTNFPWLSPCLLLRVLLPLFSQLVTALLI